MQAEVATRAYRRRGMKRRKLVWLITSFIAVVLLLEGGARVVASNLEEPLRWYSPRVQRIVEAMETERAAGRSSDIVFAGNSAVAHAMHMPTFERVLQSVDVSRNVAIPAGDARTLERWLPEEVVPRLHPDRVVIGLTSMDVNRNRPKPTYKRYEKAPAGRTGIIGAIDRFLSKHSMLARYRTSLRSPEDFTRALNAEPPDPDPKVKTALMGRWHDRPNKTEKELRRIRRGPLKRFEISQKHLAALRSTLEQLTQQGIDVVVVFTPMPATYRGAHPRGERDFRDALRAMEMVAKDVGVPTIDFSDALPDRAFKDHTHVWLREAPRFSKRVAAALTELGF